MRYINPRFIIIIISMEAEAYNADTTQHDKIDGFTSIIWLGKFSED